jgi:hypothetical protein
MAEGNADGAEGTRKDASNLELTKDTAITAELAKNDARKFELTKKRLTLFEITTICLTLIAVLLGVGTWKATHDSAVLAHEDADKLLQSIGVFELRGHQIFFDGRQYMAPEGPIQIQFWTPSAKTKLGKEVKPWEIMDDDSRLDEFGDKLISIVAGYRRYEIVGAGRGDRKPGTWWISTNGPGFKLAEFLKLYVEFWHPGDDNTYMEIQPVANAYAYPGYAR